MSGGDEKGSTVETAEVSFNSRRELDTDSSALESLRVRTRVVGLQPDLRRGGIRELRYRQGRNCDCTDYDRKDRNHDCDNGPIDEELGHSSIPFAFCLISQRSVDVALVGLGLYGHSRPETLLPLHGPSFPRV